MSQIDVVRPNATSIAGGWTAVGAASLWQATSDNSDATYANKTTDSTAMRLRSPTYSPAAGFEAERYRIRWRAAGVGGIGDAVMNSRAIPNLSGESFSFLSVGLTTTITEYTGPWVTPTQNLFSISFDFMSAVGFYFSATSVRVHELYIDVDTRNPPIFTPDVQDGAGASVSGGTLTDTNIPRYFFGGGGGGFIDSDFLPMRDWTINIYEVTGPDVLVETLSGTGVPPEPVTGGSLANGSYRADFQASSTIRGNSAYFSTVNPVSFDVAFVPPEAPDLALTPTANPPSIEVCWTVTPGATVWDDDDLVVTEIRRTDCNGTQTIYVAVGFEDCWDDRFMSLSYNGVFCGESDHICEVCYEARQWGLVDTVLVSTDWSTAVCETSLANPTPGNAWIRGGTSGDLSICPDESFGIMHPFGAFQPIAGGIPTVVTGAPGGRDYTLSIPVTSEADLNTLLGILGQAVVYYQPVAAADLWLSAMPRSVTVTKVGRIRVVDVPFVAVNPQPQPDPASLVT